MTLNSAIKAILEDDSDGLSAEAKNSLHGATEGHPWCEGKDIEQRRMEVLFAIAGRNVSGPHRHQVQVAEQ